MAGEDTVEVAGDNLPSQSSAVRFVSGAVPALGLFARPTVFRPWNPPFRLRRPVTRVSSWEFKKNSETGPFVAGV